MVPRASLILAALAATACFSDTAPDGLSTAGSTTSTGASTTDASATSTTGGPGSGGGASTTGASPTGTGTDETTSTTLPGTGTTLPGTAGTTGTTGTTTTGPDTGSTGTNAGDFDVCAAADDRFSCYQCCGEATPDWSIYLDGIADCSCNILACASACNGSLCDGLPITEDCFACIAPMAGGRCFSMVDETCKSKPGCAPFFACIEAAQCAAKPN